MEPVKLERIKSIYTEVLVGKYNVAIDKYDDKKFVLISKEKPYQIWRESYILDYYLWG